MPGGDFVRTHKWRGWRGLHGVVNVEFDTTSTPPLPVCPRSRVWVVHDCFVDSMALTLRACLAQSCLKGVCEKLNVPDAEDDYINFSLHTCLDGVTSACVCCCRHHRPVADRLWRIR